GKFALSGAKDKSFSCGGRHETFLVRIKVEQKGLLKTEAPAPSQERAQFPTAMPAGLSQPGYSFFLPPWARAAPRMSPREAPESADPYCSTASFSSRISMALIDRPTLRPALSNWVTSASTLSPTAKRSGRCSERSRERSPLRMNPFRAPSAIDTSMPPDVTSVTVVV